jgi:hypothetical protein
MKTEHMIIEKIDTGERFVATETGVNWRHNLKQWDRDHSKPCPLPVGHHAFLYPELYGCRVVRSHLDGVIFGD